MQNIFSTAFHYSQKLQTLELASLIKVYEMKKGASKFIKQVLAAMNSVKARLALISMLRNKKLLMNMASVSKKLNNNLLGGPNHNQGGGGNQEDKTKAIVLYQESRGGPATSFKLWMRRQMAHNEEEEGEDYDEDDFEVKFPDMMMNHSSMMMEDEEEEFLEEGGDDVDNMGTESVIEMVKSSREECGEEFKLEDEIDHVADLYIQRFHCQLRMQNRSNSSSLKRLEWPH